MPAFTIKFQVNEDEIGWLLNHAYQITDELPPDFENRLLDKIRALRASPRQFQYQKNLHRLVFDLARMYFDKNFKDTNGTPILGDEERKLIALALDYFVRSEDQVSDDKYEYYGLLDDYVLLSIVAQYLDPFISEFLLRRSEDEMQMRLKPPE